MDIKSQLKAIKKGVVDLIFEKELIEKLKEGRPLRIKFGVDPTAPDIHLGHTVILQKLRTFQKLGHQIIFLIGDFTAQIGDPSGKSQTRIRLSFEEVKKNCQSYQEQVYKILDLKKTKVVYNSSWLSKMNIEQIIKLTSLYTVARMLERDDFKNRYLNGKEITILEFLYPLLQGYDSVKIEADVEIGGTEQKFNLLVGRSLQKDYGQKPQVVITMPLLEGIDGVKKMSKSFNNYIGITETPKEIFGKIMSIPDQIMLKYYNLLLDTDEEELLKLEEGLKDGRIHPKEAKKNLAREIVSLYHGLKKAKEAEEEFERVFKYKGIPQELDEFKLKKNKIKLVDLMLEAKLVKSKSEAKRLISQGGVKLDQEKVSEIDHIINIEDSAVLQVGKRRFVKLIPKD
jgi:tyrosyl-tRNA synthetase